MICFAKDCNAGRADSTASGSPPAIPSRVPPSTLDTLPERERAVWRSWFEHYVFGAGHDAVAHLPPQARSVLGETTPEMAAAIKHRRTAAIPSERHWWRSGLGSVEI